MHTLTSIREALKGRFHVERILGEGGMAQVFLATDLKLNRPVAIKVFHDRADLDPERFHLEISITAQMTHPNIVPVFDSGEHDSLLYYVMPFVEGQSLRDKLRHLERLPVPLAEEIIGNVAKGLSYAHERGIVHRDVKPENILIVPDSALIADFGIARAVNRPIPERLTATGAAIGTWGYMSPEQALGLEVDTRSDVYALGCVLWEMLHGEPFTEVMSRLPSDASVPSLHDMRPEIPSRIDSVLQKSLELNPADRFSDASEFADALGIRQESTELIRSDPEAKIWPSVRKLASVAGIRATTTRLTVFAIIAVALTLLWWGTQQSRRSVSFDLGRAAVLQLVSHTPESPGLARRLSNGFVDRLRSAINVAEPSRDAESLRIARETNSAFVVRTSFTDNGGATNLAISVFNAFDRTTEDLQLTSSHPDSLARHAADTVTSLIMSLSRSLQGQTGCPEAAEAEMRAGRTARADGRVRSRADESAFALAAYRNAERAYGRAIEAGCPSGRLGRGWVRLEKARLANEYASDFQPVVHDSIAHWVTQAIDDATMVASEDSALSALELLGIALHERFVLGLSTDIQSVRLAETLLNRVIDESESVAAYLALTKLYYDLDDVEAAGHLASAAENRRAVFAQAPEEVLLRVFWTAFDLRDATTAVDACISRSPAVPAFALCRMWLMAEGVLAPNLDTIAVYLDEMKKEGSHHLAEANLVAAAVYAEEGLLVEARGLIRDTETIRLNSPIITAYSWPLTAKEAWARTKVGQVDEPMQLLLTYLEANPSHTFCPNDERWLPLRVHPRFADITRSGDDPLCRQLEPEDNHDSN